MMLCRYVIYEELKSTVLSALASQITSAKGDPFAKIKTLIQELNDKQQIYKTNKHRHHERHITYVIHIHTMI